MDSAQIQSLLEQPVIAQPMGLFALALICLLAQFIVRRWMIAAIERLVLRSSTDWDDHLHNAQVFER